MQIPDGLSKALSDLRHGQRKYESYTWGTGAELCRASGRIADEGLMDLTQGFELDLLPVRLRFGARSSATLPDVLDELGVVAPLMIGTPAAEQRYAEVYERLDRFSPARFFAAEPHCPVEIVERCRQTYKASNRDSVVAIGGGSTLGLGKILAAEESAKFVALPTTYSGSEMTPLFGRKIGKEKRVGRDVRCRPHFVIYDPTLTRDLPAHVAVTSGMNSIAHAVEALYPERPDPLTPGLAEQALCAHAKGLKTIARGTRDDAALSAVQYGGLLGGLLVSICGIALHHRLCHVIGGLYDLPHGETNSAILPQAVNYNLPAIPKARKVIEKIFGSTHAARSLFDFAEDIGAPLRLRDLGMPESGIETVASAMLEHGGFNPRPLERDGLRQLMRDAFEGRRP